MRANIIHLITQRLEHGERDSAGRLGDVGRHGDDLAVALVDGGRGSRVDDCRRVVLLQGIHSHYSLWPYHYQRGQFWSCLLMLCFPLGGCNFWLSFSDLVTLLVWICDNKLLI